MKAITPGYLYELDNFEGDTTQKLQFIEKEPAVDGETALVTITDGTTNEEVLRMLIDRMSFLHANLPSLESAIAITKIQDALLWLEKRTANRKARGVEGTHAK